MTKNIKRCAVPLMAAVLAIVSGGICRADDVAETSRKIFEANKDAIVTVEMVIEMSMDSDKQETKSNSTGVIIDPSGLVITSLAASNPGEMSQQLSMRDGGLQLSSKVIDAKIRMSDNSEVPVDVVLRDRDLDMVFLRPKKPADQPFKFIDLSQCAAPQLMDQTLTLSRLGQIANRSISVSLSRVSAIVNKPRLCYVISDLNSLGCPAFTMDGKVVGIALLRTSASRDGAVATIYDKMLPVILPCSTIQSAAAQAKTAAPEKAVEAPAKSPEPAAVKEPAEEPVKKPATKPAAKAPAKKKTTK